MAGQAPRVYISNRILFLYRRPLSLGHASLPAGGEGERLGQITGKRQPQPHTFLEFLGPGRVGGLDGPLSASLTDELGFGINDPLDPFEL